MTARLTLTTDTCHHDSSTTIGSATDNPLSYCTACGHTSAIPFPDAVGVTYCPTTYANARATDNPPVRYVGDLSAGMEGPLTSNQASAFHALAIGIYAAAQADVARQSAMIACFDLCNHIGRAIRSSLPIDSVSDVISATACALYARAESPTDTLTYDGICQPSKVRQALGEVFAREYSLSMQATLDGMADSADDGAMADDIVGRSYHSVTDVQASGSMLLQAWKGIPGIAVPLNAVCQLTVCEPSSTDIRRKGIRGATTDNRRRAHNSVLTSVGRSVAVKRARELANLHGFFSPTAGMRAGHRFGCHSPACKGCALKHRRNSPVSVPTWTDVLTYSTDHASGDIDVIRADSFPMQRGKVPVSVASVSVGSAVLTDIPRMPDEVPARVSRIHGKRRPLAAPVAAPVSWAVGERLASRMRADAVARAAGFVR